MVRRHQLERVRYERAGGKRHRLDDHPGLGTLDLVHLGDLRVDGEVTVDDPHSAFTRERDCKARLGDRVHRGRDDRDLDRDCPRQPRCGRNVVREDSRLGRDEQDVVERQPLFPELPVELKQPLDLACL